MLVRKVMTRKVITVKKDDTLEKVLEKFSKHHISGMPVVEKGRLIGIVSESDVIKAIDAYDSKVHFDTDEGFAVILAVLKHKRQFDAIKNEIIGSENIRVKSFMVREVITASPDMGIIDAARLMTRKKLKRLPVVKGKKLVGILSRADIVRSLGK